MTKKILIKLVSAYKNEAQKPCVATHIKKQKKARGGYLHSNVANYPTDGRTLAGLNERGIRGPKQIMHNVQTGECNGKTPGSGLTHIRNPKKKVC